MPLQLSAEPLQFTASQHGPAVLALQLILLLHHLEQLLLQNLELLLIAAMLLQLQKDTEKSTTCPLRVKIHTTSSFLIFWLRPLTSSACFLMMASSFCSGVLSLFKLCISSMASFPEHISLVRFELNLFELAQIYHTLSVFKVIHQKIYRNYKSITPYNEKSFWQTIKGMWKYYFTCSSVADGCTYTLYSSAYTPISFSTTWTFADWTE